MTPEQISLMLQLLEQIRYLLQVCSVGIAFLCGFVSAQFIMHAKNQKHLF